MSPRPRTAAERAARRREIARNDVARVREYLATADLTGITIYSLAAALGFNFWTLAERMAPASTSPGREIQLERRRRFERALKADAHVRAGWEYADLLGQASSSTFGIWFRRNYGEGWRVFRRRENRKRGTADVC